MSNYALLNLLLYKVDVPIMSQPVLWVIQTNYFASIPSIQLLGQLIVPYEILLSDKLFPFPIEFSCKFLLILYLEKVFQSSMNHFNKIISFGIFSHSYLVFTTMPHFRMAAKSIGSVKEALGHYKLDHSFPSTARMPFKPPPAFSVIALIFY